MTQAPRAPLLRGLHVAVLSAALAAAVALPSIRNDFVEDDVWVVAQRPLLRHPPSLPALLEEPYWPRSFGGRLWRPLVLSSYALDYRVSDSPHWFHAVTVAWAALAAALLALLATALADARVGLVTGVLFAVHPLHVEATASIVGRAELMTASGYAIALLCALQARSSRAWLLGVTLGAALAIGSKEHAVTLPIAAALLLGWRGEPWRRSAWAIAAALLPVVVYFGLRSAVTGSALAPGGLAPGLEGLSLPARAWAMLGVSVEWFRLLLFPAHLSADWSIAQVPVALGFTARHLLALGLWIGALALLARNYLKAPAAVLGLLWLLLTIVPVANVLVPTEIVLAERTLYLPSWGALLALSALGVTLKWPRPALGGAFATIALALAVRSVLRVDAWRDGERWHAALLRDAPRSYRTLWVRGNDAFDAHQWGTGERLLKEAILTAPGIPGPAEDLARYYGSAGLTGQAVTLLTHAMTLNMTRTRPWLLLEDALLKGGDSASAVRWADSASARFPRDPDVLIGTLNVLLETGRCEAARARFSSGHAVLAPDVAARARTVLAACREGVPTTR